MPAVFAPRQSSTSANHR